MSKSYINLWIVGKNESKCKTQIKGW
jgi:hypothetical protein